MIIPKSDPARSELLQKIVETAFATRSERVALYAKRSSYYTFGTNDGTISLHNRLNAMLDLVASFLYSPDHASFSLNPPRNSTDEVINQMVAAENHWNDEFRDCDLAYQYQDGINWALVYDTLPIKMGYNDERKQLFGRILNPSSIGVWREDEGDFDNQEAIVHRYSLNLDNAVQRLYRAGLKDRVKDLKVEYSKKGDDDEGPPSFRQLMVTGTASADLSAPMTGTVTSQYETRPSYQADIHVPLVPFYEAWVWDSQSNDYAVFTMIEPGIVLSDSRETVALLSKVPKGLKKKIESQSNIFLPNEHPFVFIQPYPKYDYAWGISGIEKVINLQVWSDTRLREIQELLARQADPPKVGSGFMGLQEEKLAALGGPGSYMFDSMPGAKVETLEPKIPEDLFREYNGITNIMLEAFGLTATVMGSGEEGVRGEAHARQLARTGSARIQKVAIALERSLSRMGSLGFKLLQRNSDEHLIADDGSKFLLNQVGGDWRMRIAGHSQSPLFRDDTREKGALLMKAGAISPEEFINFVNPHNKQQLIASYKKRAEAKAALAARGMLPEQRNKPGPKPQLSVVS